MIHGIDVSSFQPKPRWQEIRDAGADFAIVKVTEGNGYTNQKAAEQVKGACAAGLLVCLYHFARPNGPDWLNDAAQEAKRFDDLADAFEQTLSQPFFCFLDVERNEPLDVLERQHWRDWANEFRRWSRDEGDRRIGWYSYAPFTSSLALGQNWEETLLWLAAYPIPFKRDCSYGKWPDAPLPWARVDVWQHGGDANKATWPGIDGPSDVNTFAGSKLQLLELIANAK